MGLFQEEDECLTLHLLLGPVLSGQFGKVTGNIWTFPATVVETNIGEIHLTLDHFHVFELDSDHGKELGKESLGGAWWLPVTRHRIDLADNDNVGLLDLLLQRRNGPLSNDHFTGDEARENKQELFHNDSPSRLEGSVSKKYSISKVYLFH